MFLPSCHIFSLNLDSIPYIAFANLKNQSSFCYKYKFKSDLPHSVFGDFRGLVVFPDQEEKNGNLIQKNKKIEYKIKARSNYQYDFSKETKKWQLKPRDIESNLINTLERTVANAKFYLINENKNNYIYGFYPNLVFLDPTFTRKLSAALVVNKNTLLPQSITACDSTKNIFWQVEFSNYNAKNRIKFPFAQNTKIILSSDISLSEAQAKNIKEVLTKRLEFIGENFYIKSTKKEKKIILEINLEIPEQNYDYKLLKKLLVSQGELKLQSGIDTILIDINSEIKEVRIINYDPYPTMEIILNEIGRYKLLEQLHRTETSSYQVILDSNEIGNFYLDKSNFSGKINFLFTINRNEIMNTIAILKSGNFFVALKIISIESK